jgi:replicative DNA helicase
LVELQIISKILQNRSLAVLQQNGINADRFISYKEEAKFIFDHYEKYGNVPDRETFLDKFRDIELVEVHESDQYLIETLVEEHLYSRLVPVVHKIAELSKTDSRQAVEYAKQELEELTKLGRTFVPGVDIIKNALDRHEDFVRRNSVKGLLGITTGIKELDEITHGWLNEDLIVIVGRTNEGKTWLMLFFLVVAWASGKRVLLYSGEMSELIVGYRFDALNEHFSNTALMHGEEDLGDSRTPEDYHQYLVKLSKTNVPFVIVTPKHLGGKRLNIPMLHQLIEHIKPDIVGIDQISLMDDHRAKKGDQERVRYTHIAEDLYSTSEKYQIPIIAPAQANREAEKEKKRDEDNIKTPELHQIGESDGVGQNASRVLAMSQVDSTLKITVRKNRYGKRNQEIMMLWDIDRGVIKPFLHVSTNKEGEVTHTRRLTTEGEELF